MVTPPLPGQLCRCLTALWQKELFLTTNLNLPWHNVRPSPLVLRLFPGSRGRPHLTQPPFRSLQRARRSPLSLLFSRPNSPASLSRSHHTVLQSPHSSAALWTHARASMPFSVFHCLEPQFDKLPPGKWWFRRRWVGWQWASPQGCVPGEVVTLPLRIAPQPSPTPGKPLGVAQGAGGCAGPGASSRAACLDT